MNEGTGATLGSNYGICFRSQDDRPERDTSAYKFWLQSAARELLPGERVKICYRHRLPLRNTVDVMKSTATRRAYYSGLMKCNAQWQCPVCASKLASKRAEAIRDAIERNRSKLLPVLATYTMRHSAHDTLDTTLTNLMEAYRKFKGTRAYTTIAAEFEIKASARSLEITHGNNGWHPHIHEVIFCDISILEAETDVSFLASALQRHLTPEWLSALGRVGASATVQAGCTVTTDYGNIAEYVAKMDKLLLPRQKKGKWGVAEELTKSNVKSVGAGGDTPFGILEKYAETGDWSYAALFIEFARATKGRSVLQWSRGGKEIVGYKEVEREETETDILLAQLSPEQWKVVRHENRIGELLDVASSQDVETFYAWLDKLPGMADTAPFYGIDT